MAIGFEIEMRGIPTMLVPKPYDRDGMCRRYRGKQSDGSYKTYEPENGNAYQEVLFKAKIPGSGSELHVTLDSWMFDRPLHGRGENATRHQGTIHYPILEIVVTAFSARDMNRAATIMTGLWDFMKNEIYEKIRDRTGPGYVTPQMWYDSLNTKRWRGLEIGQSGGNNESYAELCVGHRGLSSFKRVAVQVTAGISLSRTHLLLHLLKKRNEYRGAMQDFYTPVITAIQTDYNVANQWGGRIYARKGLAILCELTFRLLNKFYRKEIEDKQAIKTAKTALGQVYTHWKEFKGNARNLEEQNYTVEEYLQVATKSTGRYGLQSQDWKTRMMGLAQTYDDEVYTRGVEQGATVVKNAVPVLVKTEYHRLFKLCLKQIEKTRARAMYDTIRTRVRNSGHPDDWTRGFGENDQNREYKGFRVFRAGLRGEETNLRGVIDLYGNIRPEVVGDGMRTAGGAGEKVWVPLGQSGAVQRAGVGGHFFSKWNKRDNPDGDNLRRRPNIFTLIGTYKRLGPVMEFRDMPLGNFEEYIGNWINAARGRTSSKLFKVIEDINKLNGNRTMNNQGQWVQ